MHDIGCLLWLVDPGWMPGAHQSRSITHLLGWTGERKYNKELVGRDKDRRDHSSIIVTGKTDSAWGKLTQFITNQSE